MEEENKEKLIEEWRALERQRLIMIKERIAFERRHCPHEAQFQLYTKFYSK